MSFAVAAASRPASVAEAEVGSSELGPPSAPASAAAAACFGIGLSPPPAAASFAVAAAVAVPAPHPAPLATTLWASGGVNACASPSHGPPGRRLVSVLKAA
jgi:hypothetical protein